MRGLAAPVHPAILALSNEGKKSLYFARCRTEFALKARRHSIWQAG